MKNSTSSTTASLPNYGASFLENHAGRIITDPEVALTELVANCWDAGAFTVKIQWPTKEGEQIIISDDGIGMTRAELETRWMTLNYNRLEKQGPYAVFPKGGSRKNRRVFGRHGIGRHAMFCFCSTYEIRTKCKGKQTIAQIHRNNGEASTPFYLADVKEKPAKGHGTVITGICEHFTLNPDDVRVLIGTRFIADPDFQIYVNNFPVTLEELGAHAERIEVRVGQESCTIWRFDNERVDRTAKQTGIAWWVNRRLVGEPSWETLEGALLDARRTPAKKYTYIVEADLLDFAVKPDWSGFYASSESIAIQRVVEDAIRTDLREQLSGSRSERKRAALDANRSSVAVLSPISQDQIAQFAEEIQVKCPTIGEKELADSVEVLAKLEAARSGYSLLHRLALLPISDLDGLNEILADWTVIDAKKVLGELRYRLSLIKQLESLVENSATDELHDLQPLFERGLWIFGPEFEAVSFLSNRTLATIIKKFFSTSVIDNPRHRPDFVIIPDASIGIYSRDAYDDSHEVSGYESVIIVELKRGESTIRDEEKDQAVRYARAIRRSGKVSKSTRITAYVLGTYVDSESSDEGETRVIPRSYSVILRQAHARTFNLLRAIDPERLGEPEDSDVRDLLRLDQKVLFEPI